METININQKINAKANAQKLYTLYNHWVGLTSLIRGGYRNPNRFSPSILIPKQHLEFREPKRNPLLIN